MYTINEKVKNRIKENILTEIYENSIKESISAIEALCQNVVGEKETLGHLLKKLEDDKEISRLVADFLKENGYEVMGEASKFKSMNVGKQMAVNNACNQYARQAGSHVKGRIVSDIAGNADDVSAEFDHFYSAYETLVEKEIKGEMQESFSVVKDFKDGTHEMQTYFIINEDAATKARIRAMENALKESQAAQKYAKKVSEFVQEGFEKEQDNSKKD